MRSLRAKILLWSFGALILSLIAFVGVSIFVSLQSRFTGFQRFTAMQMDIVREAYQTGGPRRAAEHLSRLQRYLSGEYYFTDSSGKDLISGQDRSALLAESARDDMPIPFQRRIVTATASEDGKYRLFFVINHAWNMWPYLPYYLPILAALAAFCWAMAVHFASPLRSLARTVERFGAGDLTVRSDSKRKDEIGELSRTFDRMAERIGTLLTAERRLLQDISHELRSPLARLTFAAELIRNAEDQDAAITRLKKEITRLSSLVGSLIQMTSAEVDPASVHREDVQLDELLDLVAEDCQVEADARGCRIALSPEFHAKVRGDQELLRRAIENVLRNSIRYTPKDSVVDVKVSAANGDALVSVRDFGPGVPEEALTKIFQPFFRVDDSRQSATGGVGIGLAIAQRAIALHHGRLWAQNAAPGLLVRIQLPLAVDHG